MAERPQLTALAQQAWAAHLRPGSWVIDATAGNGHDTAFLAQLASRSGRVFAFDLQESALQATAQRLETDGCSDWVTLIKEDHARMVDRLPPDAAGRIDLVCFNLGYLPTGDHTLTTKASSTLAALKAAVSMMREGALLSVIAYRGHPGAMEEAEAVERFFTHPPVSITCLRHLATGSEQRPGPEWWMALKAGG